MGTETLKTMKEQLMSCIQGQMGDLKHTDTKELGEAIDMVKDLSEAIYYCTITESMEKADDKEGGGQQVQPMNVNYYTTPMWDDKTTPYRDMERMGGRMYYPMNYPGDGVHYAMDGGSRGNSGGSSYYTEWPDTMMRDPREVRAGQRRRMYMEGKEKHNDKNAQLRELEAYLQELSGDVAEMIKDASPEEKTTLRQKMTKLAEKIV
jgi:hypothetical protein